MITGQNHDTSVTDNGSCKTTHENLRQDIEDGCSRLKKARYSWQVKNKTWNFVNGYADLDASVTRNQDSLTKNANLSDSFNKSCCSYSLHNGFGKSEETLNCSSTEINEIKTNECDSCTIRSVHYEEASVHTTINGTFDNDKNGFDDLDADPAFPYKLNSIKKSDSSQLLLPSQLSEKQNHECSSAFSSVQGEVTLSNDPAEPLGYTAMPIGTWLQEYGLMRAELDNDINKALEHLRHLADWSAQSTRQAYLAKRISLETAGIYQVIEQHGLRTCSSNVSNATPKLGSYDKSLGSYVTGFPTSPTFMHENCDSDSVLKYICENSVENEAEPTTIPKKKKVPTATLR